MGGHISHRSMLIQTDCVSINANNLLLDFVSHKSRNSIEKITAEIIFYGFFSIIIKRIKYLREFN